ncbi:ABC transporter permease [Candidatus Formimonas warabiya]|uniref:Peptide ABC transporter permease n=1 Tax=Formimonas warabiya TaxID=1761012 RepID=A0A3G1KZ59_FORW1|nr:ABC transporter permease [Candidatus Formimonas warabiya]ATW27649.1 peptide ABC transporter permease [Candidatus Formimonas warabiya]
MKKYIMRRLLLSLIVLLGVVFITFTITRILPADPALKWAGVRATPEQIAAARIELGLDQPVYVQFGKYLGDLVQGDLGYSYRTKRSVTDELLEAIPATVELVAVAMFVAVILGIFFGIASTKYKNRWIDHLVRLFSIGAVSLPPFWVALALQLIFYGLLKILPLGGRVSTDLAILYPMPHVTGLLILDSLLTGNFMFLKDALWHMILPIIPVAMYPIGMVARLTRSSMLEIMGEDYIKAARSYGIRERFILWVYALKNTLGATVTVVALSIGYALVNTFLVESIFSWPGIGKYVADAILSLDYPAIMGVTLFSAVAYLILNLIADLVIALDPRIRI